MKLVLNKGFDSFNLSREAFVYFCNLKGLDCYFYKMLEYYNEPVYSLIVHGHQWEETLSDETGIFLSKYIEGIIRESTDGEEIEKSFISPDILWECQRFDADLILTVEKFGEKANYRDCKLEIIDVPDAKMYDIIETYGGMEIAVEKGCWF